MLQIGKIKVNIYSFLLGRDKSRSIKLQIDTNNNEENDDNNLSTNVKTAVPSLKDMEFSWTENL
jgi:hypothetical protein